MRFDRDRRALAQPQRSGLQPSRLDPVEQFGALGAIARSSTHPLNQDQGLVEYGRDLG
jgi:hypothetical protein